MRKNFIEEIYKKFIRNNNVFFLTGDLGYGVLNKFIGNERFVNVGICEQNMASMAAGIASRGNKVIIYSIGNFTTLRCLEQIRNDIAYHNQDVVIVSTGAGFEYGAMGMTHHMLEDIAVMNAIPNIHIFSPSNQNEARNVAKYVMNHKGPHYVRIGKYLGEDLEKKDVDIRSVIKINDCKEAPSLIIYFTGAIRYNIEKALSLIPKEKKDKIAVLSVAYVNGSNLYTNDIKLDKLKSVLVIEEHIETGGLYSIILKKYNENSNFKNKILIDSMAVKKSFISEVGKSDYLLDKVGLGYKAIYKKIIDTMKGE